MGAFNDVIARVTCPSCAETVEVEVQFKYGDVWQHRYTPGDKLRWGGNDNGRPGRALVVVDGEATTCPACGYGGDWPAYVMIERDLIQSVVTATGEHDFAARDELFIVLEESSKRQLIDAEISLLATSDGGRTGALASGYRSLLRFEGTSIDFGFELEVDAQYGPTGLMPGQSGRATLSLWAAEELPRLDAGLGFEIREGVRVVGHGRILRAVRDEPSRRGA